MIPKALLRKLIEIGKAEDFNSLHTMFPKGGEEKYGYIMREHWREWYPVAEALSTENLIALIKTLTIAEYVLKEWSAGSVSPVIWLYRKLAERNYPKIDDLTNWVLAHTDNHWVPFTNFGGKSIEEFKRNRDRWEAHKRENQRKEDERKRAGIIKRQQKVVSHKLRLEKQEKGKEARASMLSKLQTMAPIERLNYIANDDEHSVLFYPDQYADVNNSVLKSLDPKVVVRLIEKIGTCKKSIWKKLASALKVSRHK